MLGRLPPAAIAVLLVLGWVGATTPNAAAAVKVQKKIPYNGKGKPTLDVYRPSGATGPLPGVMAVHGGTWTHDDGGNMAKFAKRIARKGFVVFRVRYAYATKRRAGFPRQARQLRKSIRWMRRNSERFGMDPQRIGAFGSSSGAHLVALVATDNRGPLDAGSRVSATVTWSAPFDLTKLREHRSAGAIKRFLGCRGWCRKRVRAASPIRHVSGDDPSMLIFNSRKELFPLSQPRSMVRKLRKAGVSRRLKLLSGKKHGAKYATRAMPQTVSYLREKLAEAPR